MIRTFHAKNYGCLRDVTAALTPLHAFIGPNDSGKSTILHGLRTLVQFASGGFQMLNGELRPFEPFIPVGIPGNFREVTIGEIHPDGSMLACDVDGGWFSYEVGPNRRQILAGLGELSGQHADSGLPNLVMNQLRTTRLVRFDPDALRTPSGLVPETAPVGFYDDRGLGLAGVYFALRNRDDGAFAAIADEVRWHFPTIKGIRVKAVTTSTVVLEADLQGGAKVEARRMSEGLLYYLAFAALRHLDPVSLLLVEEPENGLHPARIGEVVRVLRSIAEQGTQVIMATHSPLVVNELLPEEVSVVTRTEAEGTKVTPITETANFAKRSSVYALGELWLSFADGVLETPLIEGRAAS